MAKTAIQKIIEGMMWSGVDMIVREGKPPLMLKWATPCPKFIKSFDEYPDEFKVAGFTRQAGRINWWSPTSKFALPVLPVKKRVKVSQPEFKLEIPEMHAEDKVEYLKELMAVLQGQFDDMRKLYLKIQDENESLRKKLAGN